MAFVFKQISLSVLYSSGRFCLSSQSNKYGCLLAFVRQRSCAHSAVSDLPLVPRFATEKLIFFSHSLPLWLSGFNSCMSFSMIFSYNRITSVDACFLYCLQKRRQTSYKKTIHRNKEPIEKLSSPFSLNVPGSRSFRFFLLFIIICFR